MFCYFAGGSEAGNDGGGIVTFWIGEVFEIERGLDGGVFGSEVKLPFGSWTRDVGRHTEGIDWRVIT